MSSNQRRSILCPNCRKLISVDEPSCPHCGTSRPGSWWKNNFWTKGFESSDRFIKILIAVNIGMYVISLLLNPRATSLSANPLMFLSPNQQSLLLFGATGTLPIDQIRGSLFLDQFPRWWTLVSANYLHGGLLHIFFNMFALRQLAPLAIREYGNYRFFIIYTLGGIGGFWVSYLFGVTLTIGASAAIFGLVGSILYYAKSRGGPYGQVLYRQIGTWVIFLFIFGFVVPGINNFGHAGGLVAGIGLGLLLGYQDKKKENLSHKFLAGICAALTVLLLGYAVIAGLIYRMLG